MVSESRSPTYTHTDTRPEQLIDLIVNRDYWETS